MNMSTENPAKAIFWEYACNHFFLDRDGAKDNYLRVGGGDNEKEEQWRKEYVEHWISQISTIDLLPLRRLMDSIAVEAIPVLLAIKDYGDDYSKFWFAFALQNLAKRQSANRHDQVKARAKAKTLWEEILSSPNGILPEHRKDVKPYMLEAFKAKTAEDYVRNYCIRKLGEEK
jgi:hypothetical protein